MNDKKNTANTAKLMMNNLAISAYYKASNNKQMKFSQEHCTGNTINWVVSRETAHEICEKVPQINQFHLLLWWFGARLLIRLFQVDHNH